MNSAANDVGRLSQRGVYMSGKRSRKSNWMRESLSHGLGTNGK